MVRAAEDGGINHVLSFNIKREWGDDGTGVFSLLDPKERSDPKEILLFRPRQVCSVGLIGMDGSPLEVEYIQDTEGEAVPKRTRSAREPARY